jgi:hypothetical protein
MTQWTTEVVLALAPDSSSAKSGRDLASEHKWLSFARNEDTTALWGECQGSSKLPYQTQLAFSEDAPTFKCSCPSRKFPCKHGLGLLLLYASDKNSFKSVAPPTWVSEWLDGRTKRAQAKTEKAEKAKEKEVDEAAQAKRAASREKKVSAGVEELSLWLRDLVRGGLAQLPNKGYSFWETAAARLVDAQAPGLARMVRELSEHVTGDTWTERLLERLGRIHLLLEAYKKLPELSETQQADVRSSIGFSQSQDELLASSGLHDTWQVLGQSITQEDKLKIRRSWLRGQETKRDALILEFAHGAGGFAAPLSASMCWTGEVVFYPSSYPLRALLKGGAVHSDKVTNLAPATFEMMMETYSTALAANPWTERVPVHITATLYPLDDWTLQTRDHQHLKLHPQFQLKNYLLELCGGHFLNLFGEWDGEVFLPLAAHEGNEHKLYPLTHQGTA